MVAEKKAKMPKSNPTTSTSILVAEVAAKYNEVPKKMTKNIVQSFLESIESHVAAGEKVRIDKLGILTVKDRAARTGRNPQTGEAITIAASKKVGFRTAASLKEAVGIKKKKADKPAADKKASVAKPAPKKKKAA